jgi:hypothetical protein
MPFSAVRNIVLFTHFLNKISNFSLFIASLGRMYKTGCNESKANALISLLQSFEYIILAFSAFNMC